MERKNAWEIWNEKTKKDAFSFCEKYKDFLSVNKTERKFVSASIKTGEKNGFTNIDTLKKLHSGARIYKINKNKQAVFAVIGAKPLTEGVRIIISHIDSPRIDFKPSPVYEDESLAFFKTIYYGGIKKYQWLTIPLSLYGTVILKNGEKKSIEVGDTPDDPVFTITDLLPHLSKDQMKKTIEEGFPGENLNILASSMPDISKDKEKTKSNLLKIFKENYGIEEEDFLSSECQAVPAGKMRDLGIDKSMLIGYGQDDRACAYTSFSAIVSIQKPSETCICILADQEEIGSHGGTSAYSLFFQYFIEEILEKTGYSLSEVKRVYEKSKAISADVASLLDPNYKEVHDLRNAARMGCGICIEKTTGARGKYGSIEPTAEYIANIRKIFDENDIIWQTAEIGKVEQGGGGTVATYLAKFGIDTIDSGIGVLSMHSPYEVTSKADIYSGYLAYRAFYNSL